MMTEEDSTPKLVHKEESHRCVKTDAQDRQSLCVRLLHCRSALTQWILIVILMELY